MIDKQSARKQTNGAANYRQKEVRIPDTNAEDGTLPWEVFLGTGVYTNRDPRTNKIDGNRIFSTDGFRSVRMGGHEMRNLKKLHYHLELWMTLQGKSELYFYTYSHVNVGHISR